MLTVLLATRNRAWILADVLETYCKLQPPPRGWKLIVVDNGSADQTAQVIASFAARLPVRCLEEPQRGKNFALNTGLGLIEGDLTVFADDDTFPNADWLVQLRQAADGQPEYSMFGGVIVPRWQVPPPPWVRWVLDAPGVECDNCEVRAGPTYGITDLSLKDGPIPPYLVYGANMAVRSKIFLSGVRFDPAIGPSGSTYPVGGETELLLQLGRQGFKAWHVQSAVVAHFIRKEQLAKSWVFARAIQFGRGQYRLSSAESASNTRSWLGTPRYLLRRIIGEGMRMVKAGVLLRQEALFRAHWRFNFFRGQAAEARNLMRKRRAQGISS